MQMRSLMHIVGRLSEDAGHDAARLRRAEAMGFDTSVVVYHGSLQRFDAFDKARLGGFTGSASSKLGFFFASSRECAKHYAVGGEGDRKLVVGIRELETRVRDALAAKGLKRILYVPGAPISLLGNGVAMAQDSSDSDEVKAALIADTRTRLAKGVAAASAYLRQVQAKTVKATKRGLGDLRQDVARAGDAAEVIIDTIRAFDGSLAAQETLGQVGAYYLRMGNPLVEDLGGMDAVGIAAIIARAKAEGHDGAIIRNTRDPRPTDVYVVFEPEQIRSVDAAFDPAKAHSPNVMD